MVGTNDDFAHAIALTGASGTAPIDNDGATTETGEVNDVYGATVWYRYVMPVQGQITLTLDGGSAPWYYRYVMIYKQVPGYAEWNNLEYFASSFFSGAPYTTYASPGDVLYFQVGGYLLAGSTYAYTSDGTLTWSTLALEPLTVTDVPTTGSRGDVLTMTGTGLQRLSSVDFTGWGYPSSTDIEVAPDGRSATFNVPNENNAGVLSGPMQVYFSGGTEFDFDFILETPPTNDLHGDAYSISLGHARSVETTSGTTVGMTLNDPGFFGEYAGMNTYGAAEWYSAKTGTASCWYTARIPESGMYAFHVPSMPIVNSWVSLWLAPDDWVKDGSRLDSLERLEPSFGRWAYGDLEPDPTGGLYHTGVMCTYPLTKGDIIYLQVVSVTPEPFELQTYHWTWASPSTTLPRVPNGEGIAFLVEEFVDASAYPQYTQSKCYFVAGWSPDTGKIGYYGGFHAAGDRLAGNVTNDPETPRAYPLGYFSTDGAGNFTLPFQDDFHQADADVVRCVGGQGRNYKPADGYMGQIQGGGMHRPGANTILFRIYDNSGQAPGPNQYQYNLMEYDYSGHKIRGLFDFPPNIFWMHVSSDGNHVYGYDGYPNYKIWDGNLITGTTSVFADLVALATASGNAWLVGDIDGATEYNNGFRELGIVGQLSNGDLVVAARNDSYNYLAGYHVIVIGPNVFRRDIPLLSSNVLTSDSQTRPLCVKDGWLYYVQHVGTELSAPPEADSEFSQNNPYAVANQQARLRRVKLDGSTHNVVVDNILDKVDNTFGKIDPLHPSLEHSVDNWAEWVVNHWEAGDGTRGSNTLTRVGSGVVKCAVGTGPYADVHWDNWYMGWSIEHGQIYIGDEVTLAFDVKSDVEGAWMNNEFYVSSSGSPFEANSFYPDFGLIGTSWVRKSFSFTVTNDTWTGGYRVPVIQQLSWHMREEELSGFGYEEGQGLYLRNVVVAVTSSNRPVDELVAVLDHPTRDTNLVGGAASFGYRVLAGVPAVFRRFAQTLTSDAGPSRVEFY